MNSSSQKVLQYLTGYNDIDAVTVEELQKLVEENPYFPVSRLLLAQKLKAGNDPAFLEEVQKTVLYYSNPQWLHYQLINGDVVSLSPQVVQSNVDSQVEVFTHTVPVENENLSLANTNSEIAEEHPITTEFSGSEIEAASELAHETLQEAETNEQDEPLSEAANQGEEEAAALSRGTDENTFHSLEQISVEEEPVIREQFEQVVLDSLTPAKQEEVVAVSEEMAGTSLQTSETTEVFLADAEKTPVEIIEDRSVDPQINSATSHSGTTEEPDEHEKMFQNIKAMLDASSEEADADVEDAAIPIDPYYTIDYFASQGIRLELEQNPQDQLGKNLKKFTQWLKHMKKLGPEDATEVIIQKETEADIVKIADSSNTAREVVTEAMASVLEKQGKKDKAIELYNKLSFLNPGKSAYFAHKIKNLNGT